MSLQFSHDPQQRGTLVVPQLPRSPGVYVVHFADGSQYVGEGVDLHKRWAFYRLAMTPEQAAEKRAAGNRALQTTNIRLKADILAELSAGRPVVLELVGEVLLDKAAEAVEVARRKRQGIQLRNR
jgi:hypothetical protein